MTIEKLIENLKNQRNSLDDKIQFLVEYVSSNQTSVNHKNKRKAIVKSVNSDVKKKKHWTQLPKNKAKLAKIMKKMQRARWNRSK